MKLMDKAKQAALAAAVKTGLGYLEKDQLIVEPTSERVVIFFLFGCPIQFCQSQHAGI